MNKLSFKEFIIVFLVFLITYLMAWRIDYNKQQRAENEKILKSEQAMNKLRLEKEKFDYGVITLERYNQIRDSLAVYIK